MRRVLLDVLLSVLVAAAALISTYFQFK